MEECAFDIYSGMPGDKAQWLESAASLESAQNRMRELALKSPGSYFIFNSWTFCTVARLNAEPGILTRKRTFASAA